MKTPTEIPFKQWLAEIGERWGISFHAAYGRYYRHQKRWNAGRFTPDREMFDAVVIRANSRVFTVQQSQ